MSIPANISMTVGVADPNNPKNVIKPNADGSVNTNSTGSGGLPAPDGAPISSVVSAPTAPTNLIAISGATVTAGVISFTAISQYVVIDTAGYGNVSAEVTGTFSATIQGQGTNDPTLTTGTGLVSTSAANPGNTIEAVGISSIGLYEIPGGSRYVIIRCTAYTSGTALVRPVLQTTRFPPRSLFAVTGVINAAGTDRSITATTTSQALAAANTARRGFFLKNDTAIAVWINFGATAVATAGGGNIQIPAGGYYETGTFVSSAAINIIAASATPAITAREF